MFCCFSNKFPGSFCSSQGYRISFKERRGVHYELQILGAAFKRGWRLSEGGAQYKMKYCQMKNDKIGTSLEGIRYIDCFSLTISVAFLFFCFLFSVYPRQCS